jgi:hypothetical protein
MRRSIRTFKIILCPYNTLILHQIHNNVNILSKLLTINYTATYGLHKTDNTFNVNKQYMYISFSRNS